MQTVIFNTYHEFCQAAHVAYGKGATHISSGKGNMDKPTPGMRFCSAVHDFENQCPLIAAIWPYAISNSTVIDAGLGVPLKSSAGYDLNRNREDKNAGIAIPRFTTPPFFRNREGICDNTMKVIQSAIFLLDRAGYDDLVYFLIDMGRQSRLGPISCLAFTDMKDLKAFYNQNVRAFYRNGPFYEMQ